jgi:hypothetical protein
MRDQKFCNSIDNLKKGFKLRNNGCRNKDGEIIREEEKILQWWEENVEKEEKGRESNVNDHDETRTERRVTGEDEVNTPTHEEIEKCIQKSKE